MTLDPRRSRLDDDRVRWEGCLAGAIERGLLPVGATARRCGLLPRIDDSPVTHILLGRESPRAG